MSCFVLGTQLGVFQIVHEGDCILHQIGPYYGICARHKFHFSSRGWPPSDDLEYHHPPLFLIPPALCYSDLHTDRMKRYNPEIVRLLFFVGVFLICKYSGLFFDKALMLCGYGS